MKIQSTSQLPRSPHSVFKPYVRPLPIALSRLIGAEADAAREIQDVAIDLYLKKGANNSDSAFLANIKKFAEEQQATQTYLLTHVAENTLCNAAQHSFLQAQPKPLQDIMNAAAAYHQAEGEAKKKQASTLVDLGIKLGERDHKQTIAQKPPATPRPQRYLRLG